MNNKKLVIHLIREELRNKLLMNSFRDLGFDCSSYTLNISEQILTLAGFDQKPDSLYQRYFDLVDNALAEITFWNFNQEVEKSSLSIYIELLETRLEGARSIN